MGFVFLVLEEDSDQSAVTSNSRLTAKPFYMPKFANNIFPLKPFNEPDAENLPTKPSHGEENDDVNPIDPENIPGEGHSDDGTDGVDGAVDGIDDGLLPEKTDVPSHPYPKPGSDPKYNGEFPSSIPEIPFGVCIYLPVGRFLVSSFTFTIISASSIYTPIKFF